MLRGVQTRESLRGSTQYKYHSRARTKGCGKIIQGTMIPVATLQTRAIVRKKKILAATREPGHTFF